MQKNIAQIRVHKRRSVICHKPNILQNENLKKRISEAIFPLLASKDQQISYPAKPRVARLIIQGVSKVTPDFSTFSY